ncbi:MAG: hypothetical protein K2N34_05630 [Lachnospiraceae bacterium]|nr:hypothetical protein [Lachnospiraceae bacterium]
MDRKYRDVIEAYMVQKAEDLERYMKVNHPWQNRTGAAEAGLSAMVSSSRFNYEQTIELSHGVPYGVYLENSMERRFAIIEPTIRLKGHEIIDDLQGKLKMFVDVREV